METKLLSDSVCVDCGTGGPACWLNLAEWQLKKTNFDKQDPEMGSPERQGVEVSSSDTNKIGGGLGPNAGIAGKAC